MSSNLPEVSNATLDRLYAGALGYNPDNDFRKLLTEATGIAAGNKLVTKDALCGIPHIVTCVTYREGHPRHGRVGDYVSVEAIVADPLTMEDFKVDSYVVPGAQKVIPNEPVVYNDSGTGIRRQLTRYFHELGLIKVGPVVPKGANPDKFNPFDTSYQFWEEGEPIAITGIKEVILSGGELRPLRYVVARGLRKSEYEYEPGAKAETHYFA